MLKIFFKTLLKTILLLLIFIISIFISYSLTNELVIFEIAFSLLSSVIFIFLYLIYNRFRRTKISKNYNLNNHISIRKIFLYILLALILSFISISIYIIFNLDLTTSRTLISLQDKVLFVMTFTIFPIIEEVIFRKIIFNELYNVSTLKLSIFFTSLAFTVFHGNFNIVFFLCLLSNSIIFSYIDTKEDSLYPSIICHCIYNFFALTIPLLLII